MQHSQVPNLVFKLGVMQRRIMPCACARWHWSHFSNVAGAWWQPQVYIPVSESKICRCTLKILELQWDIDCMAITKEQRRGDMPQPAKHTHLFYDHLSLQRDHREPPKVKILLPTKLERRVSLLDVQQVLDADAKGVVFVVAGFIADNHACHEWLSHP